MFTITTCCCFIFSDIPLAFYCHNIAQRLLCYTLMRDDLDYFRTSAICRNGRKLPDSCLPEDSVPLSVCYLVMQAFISQISDLCIILKFEKIFGYLYNVIICICLDVL